MPQSLTEHIRDIERAWNGSNGSMAVPSAESTHSYVVEVFDQYVVVNEFGNGSDLYYKVPYSVTLSGDDIESIDFADRSEWVEVEQQTEWVAKMAELKAALFDVEAPCGKKAIKVIQEGSRRIGAYATVWGELDCDGERMTQGAIQPYVEKGAVPLMLWLHGVDPEIGTAPPGVWDAKSFKIDDVGFYAEGNIFRDAAGNKAWQRITEAKSFGLSVMTAWYLVQREQKDDGTVDIVDWPLMEISIMEGGRQCVPSAHQDIEGKLATLYRKTAAKMHVGWLDAASDDNNVLLSTGDEEMPTAEEVAAKVREQLAAEQVEREEAARKAAQTEEANKAVVAEAARAVAEALIAESNEQHETALAEIRETHEAAIAEVKSKNEELEEQLEKARKGNRGLAPAGGVPETGELTPNIKVFSPYDRLSTFDLSLRYELMRSYGKQPSNKMWRALASRVVQIAREEDTVRIEHGQAVKEPAVDWEVLVPRDLDMEEIDGEVFGTKAGQMDRFTSGGLDSSADNVTPVGLKQFAEIAIKANELVYSTQASAGDEWVPTLMTAQLWRTIRLNAAVMPLFSQFDMPSQPYDYPIESTDPTFYKVGETTDESQLVLTGGPFTDSKPGTGKKTFSAGKLGAISYWSEEMEEDSIIAVEPQFRDQYGVKFAHVLDEILISGDETTGTTNISLQGSAISAASRFLVLDGLRHEPMVTTTADKRDAGALTIDDFGNTQALMGVAGKFGVNPASLVFISDPGVFHKAKLLSEVLTLDKFGSAATVLTGQLASIFSVPYIVSEDYALTDATGHIDGTAGDNTLGSFLCVNKRGVMVGWRRRPRVRVVGLPGAEARYIVGSARLDMQYKEAGMVALSYNVTV